MNHRSELFLAAAFAGLLLQAGAAGAQTNAYVQLQGVEAGGAGAYQNAADGSLNRQSADGAPVRVGAQAATTPPPAIYGREQRAEAEPPSPSVGSIDRSQKERSGGSSFSILGAGLGAAVGYGAAVLVSATLFCLPLWGILAFVAGGALAGGLFLKKFF